MNKIKYRLFLSDYIINISAYDFRNKIAIGICKVFSNFFYKSLIHYSSILISDSNFLECTKLLIGSVSKNCFKTYLSIIVNDEEE